MPSAPGKGGGNAWAPAGRPLRVAVVGAGPAGFYTAGHLLDSDVDVEVDLLDRLPTPYGLVRSGVAPDHPKLKSVTRVFEAIAARPGLRFLGNVAVGAAVTVAELSEWYDGVVYAVGASTHRRAGVPGEDLAGSLSATEFVGWYNGHPDHRDVEVDLSVARALVVGNGNVALDVARILLQNPAELACTDIADHALAALRASTVREVVVLGRRGPAQSSFSAQELRELGALSGVEIAVEPPGPYDAAGGDAATAKSLRVVRDLAQRRAGEAARRLVLRFQGSPAEVLGRHRVEGVRIVRNRLVPGADGTVLARPTGESTVLPVGLVVHAIGYRGEPVPGLPFDESRGVVPNHGGRVRAADGSPHGTYVAGWIKRGASGLIGTNRGCAKDTVETLLADAAAGRLTTAGTLPAEAVADRMAERVAVVVSHRGWQALDAHERRLGEPAGRPRVKVTRVADMLDVAGHR